jgi:hypothetical protein
VISFRRACPFEGSEAQIAGAERGSFQKHGLFAASR